MSEHAGLLRRPQLQNDRRDVLLNPTLIVEVLSDFTEGYDGGAKFASYRQIPSLKEHLLVCQGSVLVEQSSGDEGGRCLLWEYCSLAARVLLPSPACTLELAQLYDNVPVVSG